VPVLGVAHGLGRGEPPGAAAAQLAHQAPGRPSYRWMLSPISANARSPRSNRGRPRGRRAVVQEQAFKLLEVGNGRCHGRTRISPPFPHFLPRTSRSQGASYGAVRILCRFGYAELAKVGSRASLVMIAASLPQRGCLVAAQKGRAGMESLTSGTSWAQVRLLPPLPLRTHALRIGHTHGLPGVRRTGLRARVAVQYPAPTRRPRRHRARRTLSEPAPSPRRAAGRGANRIDQAGEYLCYEDGGEMRTVALSREWTRIGRSLAPTCASMTQRSRAGTP